MPPPVKPRTGLSKQFEHQRKVFTSWVKSKLIPAGIPFRTFKDFSDGTKLLKLIEIISGDKLPRPERGKSRVHHITNVNHSLAYLKTRGIALSGLRPHHVVDVNMKMILGLMWQIILRFDVQEISWDDKTAKDGLLSWAKEVTRDKRPKVMVNNFHMSFLDGLAIAAILHHYHPERIDFDSMTSEDVNGNFKKAFQAAQDIGLPVIDDDISSSARLDEKALITLLCQWYRALSPPASIAASDVEDSGSTPATPYFDAHSVLGATPRRRKTRQATKTDNTDDTVKDATEDASSAVSTPLRPSQRIVRATRGSRPQSPALAASRKKRTRALPSTPGTSQAIDTPEAWATPDSRPSQNVPVSDYNGEEILGRNGYPIPEGKVAQLRQLFEMVDSDKDGKISAQQLGRLVQDELLRDPKAILGSPFVERKFGKGNRPTDRLRRHLSGEDFTDVIMDALDHDGDGMLTFPEFCVATEDVFDENGGINQEPSFFRAEAKAMSAVVLKLEDEIEDLRRVNRDLEGTLGDQNERHRTEYEASQVAADAQIEETEKSLADMKKELQKMRANNRALQSENEVLQEAAEPASRTGSMKEKDLRSKKAIADLQAKIASLQVELENVMHEKESADIAFQAQLGTLDGQLKRANHGKERLEGELSKLRNEANNSNDYERMIDDLQRRNQDLNDEIEVLRNTERSMLPEFASMSGLTPLSPTQPGVENELAALDPVNRRSQNLESQNMEEIAGLAARLAELEKLLAEKDGHIIRLQTEGREMKAWNDMLEEEGKNHKKQQNERDLQLAKLRELQAESNNSIRSLQQTSNRLRQELANSNDALEATRQMVGHKPPTRTRASQTDPIPEPPRTVEESILRMSPILRMNRPQEMDEEGWKEAAHALKKLVRKLEEEIEHLQEANPGGQVSIQINEADERVKEQLRRSEMRNKQLESDLSNLSGLLSTAKHLENARTATLRATQQSVRHLEGTADNHEAARMEMERALKVAQLELRRALHEMDAMQQSPRVQVDVHREVLQHRIGQDGKFAVVSQRNEHERYIWYMSRSVDGIRAEPWTQEEDALLLREHDVCGDDWEALAAKFPGRTDTGIYHHYRQLTGKEPSQTPFLPNPFLDVEFEDMGLSEVGSSHADRRVKDVTTATMEGDAMSLSSSDDDSHQDRFGITRATIFSDWDENNDYLKKLEEKQKHRQMLLALTQPNLLRVTRPADELNSSRHEYPMPTQGNDSRWATILTGDDLQL